MCLLRQIWQMHRDSESAQDHLVEDGRGGLCSARAHRTSQEVELRHTTILKKKVCDLARHGFVSDGGKERLVLLHLLLNKCGQFDIVKADRCAQRACGACHEGDLTLSAA